MARVTVEDCVMNVSNRFDLVLKSSQRAKQIASGAPLTVDRDNDKDAVVALREIADKTVDMGQLDEIIIQQFCRRHPIERLEKEDVMMTREDIKAAYADETSGAPLIDDPMLTGKAADAGMSFEGEDVEEGEE